MIDFSKLHLTEQNKSILIENSRKIMFQIRQMEDLAKAFKIDIKNDKLYITLVAYRRALDDLIQAI